jgi:preprotein translocase subunit SecG
MKSIFDWIVVVDAVVVAILILVQVRGASIGAGMGGGGEVFNIRRGSDKTLHQFTIVCVALFCASIIASIIA